MKPYLLFIFNPKSPGGGWNDFSKAFEKVSAAVRFFDEIPEQERKTLYCHIIYIYTGLVMAYSTENGWHEFKNQRELTPDADD